MPSKIQVDQIAGATGSTVTLPSGQTLDLSSGTVNLPSSALSALNASNLTSGTVPSARLSLTSSDLPTVPTTKGGTGLTTIGTANQVLRVNSGATALEFGSVSSDFVLLATTDASSSSSVSFDGYFSSTYKNYQIIISSLRPSADATMYMRFRRSNADVTASNYTYACARGHINNSGSSAVDNDPTGFDQSAFDFGDGLNAGETAGFGANIMIYDPLDTTVYKTFTAQHHWEYTNNAQWQTSNWGGVLRNSTAALSGVSFYMASGTISQGNFKLYGIK